MCYQLLKNIAFEHTRKRTLRVLRPRSGTYNKNILGDIVHGRPKIENHSENIFSN